MFFCVFGPPIPVAHSSQPASRVFYIRFRFFSLFRFLFWQTFPYHPSQLNRIGTKTFKLVCSTPLVLPLFTPRSATTIKNNKRLIFSIAKYQEYFTIFEALFCSWSIRMVLISTNTNQIGNTAAPLTLYRTEPTEINPRQFNQNVKPTSSSVNSRRFGFHSLRCNCNQQKHSTNQPQLCTKQTSFQLQRRSVANQSDVFKDMLRNLPPPFSSNK